MEDLCDSEDVITLNIPLFNKSHGRISAWKVLTIRKRLPQKIYHLSKSTAEKYETAATKHYTHYKLSAEVA